MFKNVASQKFIVFAFDATTNIPKTGDAANITAYISKDFGTVTVLGDTSATEMDATNAPGYYLFDGTQTETNADCILVSGKSSTANIKIIGAPATIFTLPPTFTALAISGGGALTVGTNNDKTGYSLTQSFPTNFSSLAITGGGSVTAGTVSDKTGYSLTSAYDLAKTASQAGDAMALTSGERNSTADALLNRDMATGTDSGGRTVRNALRFLRNKFSISGSTLTVTKEDDTTTAWTSTLTTDATAIPITASDPA